MATPTDEQSACRACRDGIMEFVMLRTDQAFSLQIARASVKSGNVGLMIMTEKRRAAETIMGFPIIYIYILSRGSPYLDLDPIFWFPNPNG